MNMKTLILIHLIYFLFIHLFLYWQQPSSSSPPRQSFSPSHFQELGMQKPEGQKYPWQDAAERQEMLREVWKYRCVVNMPKKKKKKRKKSYLYILLWYYSWSNKKTAMNTKWLQIFIYLSIYTQNQTQHMGKCLLNLRLKLLCQCRNIFIYYNISISW